MVEPTEEVNLIKVKLNRHRSVFHILDFLIIILNKEDTLDDNDHDTNNDSHASIYIDMYETIDVDHDLFVML